MNKENENIPSICLGDMGKCIAATKANWYLRKVHQALHPLLFIICVLLRFVVCLTLMKCLLCILIVSTKIFSSR